MRKLAITICQALYFPNGMEQFFHAIGSKIFQSTGDNGACHKQNSMDLSFGKKNNYK